MYRKILFLVLGLHFLGTPASAQYLDVGLYGGLSVYRGDLSPDNPFSNFSLFRPGGGIFARYNVNDLIGVRLMGTYANLRGDDALSDRPRNLNFKSHLLEIALTGEWNILGYQPYNLARPFSPYLFAGVALANFNPKGSYNGEWIPLRPLGTEGQNIPGVTQGESYSTWIVAIPVGLGAKYAINDKLNVGLEVGFRFTFTDYLDDVSTNYVADGIMLEQGSPIAAAMANRSGSPVVTGQQRGNADRNDAYLKGGIWISYNLTDNGLVGSRKRGKRGKGCY